MASARKKLDEKHLKTLRELASRPANKECFDCHQRGPTYVNVTVGSFVCTTCSGLLRGLTPPHRVKSISMATFSREEVELVRARGNEYCRRVWLGLCDNDLPTKDEQQIKDFMISKYEKKRYYTEPTEDMKITLNGSSNQSSPARSPPISQTPASLSIKPPPLNNGHIKMGLSGSTNGLQSVAGTSSGNGSGAGVGGAKQVEDPFSPVSAQSGSEDSTQSSFANFENNPIFSAAAASSSSTASTSASTGWDTLGDLRCLDVNSWSSPSVSQLSQQQQEQPSQQQFQQSGPNRWSTLLSSEFPPFSSPWETSLQSTSLPNNRWSYAGGTVSAVPPTEDRYAALKDLDSLMKTQMASEQHQQQHQQQQQQQQQAVAGSEWGNSNGIWPMNVFNSVQPSLETSKSSSSSNPFTGDNGWNDSTTFIGNPFKSPSIQSEISWPLSNGQLANGFPTSQSLNFGPTAVPWKTDPLPNPFTVGLSSQVKTHHSSNPFL